MKKWRLASCFVVLCVFMCIAIVGVTFNLASAEDAEEKADAEIVVVSMGDSFSSGEGIEHFYGYDDPNREKNQDWLAHRSMESWPGRLTFSIKNTFYKLKDCKCNPGEQKEAVSWYFVAASGAETKHLYEGQRIEYSFGHFESVSVIEGWNTVVWKATDTQELDPQLSVFEKIPEGTVDYVTITIGGNDAHFADVVEAWAAPSAVSWLFPNRINSVLNDVWDEFYHGKYEIDKETAETIEKMSDIEILKDLNANSDVLLERYTQLYGKERAEKELDKAYNIQQKIEVFYGKKQSSIKERLKEAYTKICEKAGSQATLLVVGYPQLFSGDTYLYYWNDFDSDKVNDNIHLFNLEISKIVEECSKEGLNVRFVSVEDEFKNHGAYSDKGEAWLNRIYIRKQSEDLKQKGVVSSYSVHPNDKGAAAYTRVVQSVIDSIEKAHGGGGRTHDQGEPTPTELTVTATPIPEPDKLQGNLSFSECFAHINEHPLLFYMLKDTPKKDAIVNGVIVFYENAAIVFDEEVVRGAFDDRTIGSVLKTDAGETVDKLTKEYEKRVKATVNNQFQYIEYPLQPQVYYFPKNTPAKMNYSVVVFSDDTGNVTKEEWLYISKPWASNSMAMKGRSGYLLCSVIPQNIGMTDYAGTFRVTIDVNGDENGNSYRELKDELLYEFNSWEYAVYYDLDLRDYLKIDATKPVLGVIYDDSYLGFPIEGGGTIITVCDPETVVVPDQPRDDNVEGVVLVDPNDEKQQEIEGKLVQSVLDSVEELSDKHFSKEIAQGYIDMGHYEAAEDIMRVLGKLDEMNDFSFPITQDYFSDNAFRAIINQYDINRDGQLSKEERNSVKEIVIPQDSNCHSLYGISLFPELESLNCEGNRVGAGLSFAKNKKLVVLNCSDCGLDFLDVSENKNLRELYCSKNNLMGLDLSNNLLLEKVNCYSNRLAALDVSNNVNLLSLICSDNMIGSLNVEKNPMLKELFCHINDINTLDLRNNVSLEYLGCASNKLDVLNISANPLIKGLDCTNNNIGSLDLSNNPNIEELCCMGNQFSSLDVSKCVNLLELECGNETLSSLDLRQNTHLKKLSFALVPSNFTLSDLSSNAELEFLQAFGKIESLNLANCQALKELHCGGCLIDLTISGCKSVEFINCTGGPLENLDLRGCSALIRVECWGSCVLKSINAEGCTALESLLCDGCEKLTLLNVKGCSALKTLSCVGCPLSEMDYRDNVSLEELICDYTRPMVNPKTELIVKINDRSFPDNQFRKYVSSFDSDGNGYLSGEERAKVKNMDLFGRVDSCINGIEVFTNLEELECTHMRIQEIDLHDMTSLKTFICKSVLAPDREDTVFINLEGCTSLEKLICDCYYLSLWLDGCEKSLKYLDLGGTSIEKLDLRNYNALEYLSTGYHVTMIDVSGLQALEEVNCKSQYLQSINLSGCSNLKWLTLESNSSLRSLDLSGLSKLKTLDCAFNRALQVIDFSGCVNLKSLDCCYCNLSELRNIYECTCLESLDCYGNQFPELDLSKFPNLSSYNTAEYYNNY